MEKGEYINVISKLEVAKLMEGKPFSVVMKSILESQGNEKL